MLRVQNIRSFLLQLTAVCFLFPITLVTANARSPITPNKSAFIPDCDIKTGSGRLAFLIGNSEYDIESGRDPLNNPAKDIVKLCNSFEKLGFSVIGVSDTTSRQNSALLSRLKREASGATTVVIYYAGHGFEYSGSNYLVPVDAPTFSSKEGLNTEFLPLNRLLDAVGSVDKFALVLLDACRTRDHVVTLPDSGGPDGELTPLGFQQFEFDNQAIIFASQKGTVAYDSLKPFGPDTSPFAAAISEALLIPGLPLNEYFGNVTGFVREKTKFFPSGQQKPFYYSGFGNVKYYLHEPAEPETGNGAVRVKPIDAAEIARVFPVTKIAIEDGPALISEALSKFRLAELLATAEAGNAFAQYLVGEMYQFGVGVEEDHDKAEYWLRKSVDQNYASGQTELAYFLQQKALTMTENKAEMEAEAILLYEKAVAQDFAKAQSHLAFALWSGRLGVTDRTRAKQLFSAASKNGHPYASFADAHYGGNRLEAEVRLRAMADAGKDDANNWICELYYLDSRVADVIEDCRIGAEAGFSGSRAIFAEAHRYAWGVKRNPKEAQFWGNLALSQFDLVPDKRHRLEAFIKTQ